MLQAQRRFNQAGDACRDIQMPQVTFHRAYCAGVFRLLSGEGRFQPGNFNRVAQWRAGAVRFDIGNVRRRDIGIGQCLGNHRLLTALAWRSESHFIPPVIIYGRPFHNGIHSITVRQRLRQRFQHDNTYPLSFNGSRRLRIKRTAVTIR